MGHGFDMQRYEGEADGVESLVVALHVANNGCGGWWRMEISLFPGNGGVGVHQIVADHMLPLCSGFPIVSKSSQNMVSG